MNIGATGKKGEDMVAAFLVKQGYTILKRNYSCRFGEIDIIATKDNILSFVEVKTRALSTAVPIEEAVDSHKAARITKAAEDYLVKAEPSPRMQPRFDVALVTVTEDNPPKHKLKYIKNAF